MNLSVKPLLFLIGIFITYDVRAQSLYDLDVQNGTRVYKLNTQIGKYINKLEFLSNDEGGIKTYRIVEPNSFIVEPKSFQNQKPLKVFLRYYRGLLYQITLYFYDNHGMDYKNISSAFETLYNSPTDFKTTDIGNFYSEWQSNKVQLSIESNKADHTFSVEYQSQIIERKILLNRN